MKGKEVDAYMREAIENENMRLSKLLEVLSKVGLSFNWVLAVASLSAQEIAVKKKLGELGEEFGEQDFQILADRLQKAMQSAKLEPPTILMSIVRAYRFIRAEILHAPPKRVLKIEECDAILNNTDALVTTLFSGSERFDAKDFMDSISRLPLDRTADEFTRLESDYKKRVFEATMDRIGPLSTWKEFEENKKILEFVKLVFKSEKDSAVRDGLFKILFIKAISGDKWLSESQLVEVKNQILPIIEEFSRSPTIQKWIVENGYIDNIIVEFEGSRTFNIAGIMSQIVLNLFRLMDMNQASRIADAIITNDQIKFSYSARPYLQRFLAENRGKIQGGKVEKLKEVLRS